MAAKQMHSPKGIAQFPWLNKADDKFGEATYKVTLKVPVEQAQPLVDKLEDMLSDYINSEKEKTGKKPKLSSDPSWEYGEDEDEGFVFLRFKQNQWGKDREWENKIRFYDAAGKPLTGKAIPRIFGGSELKVAFAPTPWNHSNKAHIKLRIAAVQIIKLSEGQPVDDGFGAEEGGYVAPDFADESHEDDEDSGDW